MADGKWINDLEATTELDQAALRVLGVRLTVVQDYLPRVLDPLETDTEPLHQLRVSTRRADAALRIFRDCLPRKVHKAARERLRKLRRAAGGARDWDVFGQELTQRLEKASAKEVEGLEYLLGYARGQRDAAQADLTQAARKYFHEGAETRDELLNSIRSPDEFNDSAILLELARPTLTDLEGKLEEAISNDLKDYANLHQVRIQGKRLRYAMEVFAGCFAGSFRSDLYPCIEAMQEILGRANDSHVACERLTPLRQRLRPRNATLWKRLQGGIEGLLRFHQRRLPKERLTFLKWWEEWQSTGRPALLRTLEVSPSTQSS